MRHPRNIVYLTTTTVLSMLSLWLGGCAGRMESFTNLSQIRAPKFDTSTVFVPNPTQFSPKQESSTPVTPADLVDGGGFCAGVPQAPVQTAENASDPAAGASAAAVSPTGRNVALQMSECEVVAAAGRPADIQISGNERGDRMVTMIYATPERPIYRFVAGRLASIERSAEPPPPAPVKKKPAARKQRAAAPPV